MAEPDAVRARSALVRWGAIPAAVGFLILVVFGSQSATFAPSGGIEAGFALSAVRIVGYVALGLGLLILPLAIALFRRRRSSPARVINRRIAYRDLTALPMWAGILVLAVFAAQIAIMVTYLVALLRAASGARDASSGLGGPQDQSPVGSLEPDTASLAIALVIVAVAIGVLLVFALKWRLEGRVRTMPARGDRAAVVTRAVEVSLAAMLREPDPRLAVIAAYAAMERVLASAGLGRVDSEAPIEYLRRVLAGSFGARDEVAAISRLFQIAKFSQHRVDESMRSEAIAALQRIREPRLGAV